MLLCNFLHMYYTSHDSRHTLYIRTLHVYISLHRYRVVYVHLLDIPRQPTCMKLQVHLYTRELYQPIQSCHVVCLGISNKSVAVPRQDSIHPCNIYIIHRHTCTCMYINGSYIHVCVVKSVYIIMLYIFY